MSKLESLEMFSKNELSVRQMSNVTGADGLPPPTDGGFMPVHESVSASGWIYYAGDEGTDSFMTYFSIEEHSWER